MATQVRDRPYSQFNFRVSWEPATNNDGDSMGEESVEAGFQEVSGIGMEITVAEYRAGNFLTNESMKVTGMVKTPDITLKRGVMGRMDLYKWLNDVRDGSQRQLKNVTIRLMTEDRSAVAQEWLLKNARPMKYTGPSLNGKGTDVAVEELVLSAERIEMPV
jgi:phage tail-like protein